MESKVLLIDANGTEIGETYSRRARQLVKQQRAIWADDTHTAIKFMPDQEEEWEISPTEVELPPPVDKSSALYALAAKRIRDRRRMIIHVLAFIPGYFLISFIWLAMTNGRMFDMSFLTMGFAWGMWTMFFISRLRAFAKEYGYSLKSRDWETRHRIRLETEVDRLKRMGYRD